ncbi:MAG: cobalt-precorrin-5B (C(1))-methyltransferase CbiD [Candidatus Aramenus sp.]|jgi:cobalt-precorrin-5B (C1)-methyltransferase|nr:cobalt-precorrin-5B (C(1))-methyltransferase CbiD [Candidatus Aramenus sp.]
MSVRIPLDYSPKSPSLSNAKVAKKQIMKFGYTTGSTIAAGAKACAIALKYGKLVNAVVVSTPIGLRIEIPVNYVKLEGEWAEASITKNGGDDPDDTNGMEFRVRMRLNDDVGYVTLRAGKGIGVARTRGLPIEEGEPAINPVPRKQLIDNLKEILGDKFGAEIVVEAPEGERIAQRTFNPRLRIEGGVSVLGTSGIVKPMSLISWFASMVEQLDVVKEKGYTTVVMVPGNIGETAARRLLNVDPESIVQMAIFVGGMVKAAAKRGFKEIVLMGHVGKMVKNAIKIWNTHYKYGDGRIETIAAYAAKHGVGSDVIRKIFECKTTDEAIDLLLNYNYFEVFSDIADKISQNAEDLVGKRSKVYTILINMKGDIVGYSKGSEKYLR